MEPWLPLITLVLGYVLRGEHLRLTERGRLPANIERQLAVWEKLPDSESKNQLREHIELQVRYLVAFETPATMYERDSRRWGWLIAALGLILPGIGFAEGWRIEWIAYLGLAGAIGISVGMTMIAESRRRQGERRLHRLVAAEGQGRGSVNKSRTDDKAAQPAAERGHVPPGREEPGPNPH